MKTQKYQEQNEIWPRAGRHILAQYDDSSIIVYQAYKPSIGKYAVNYQKFGGGFSFDRMSWIKPNFLWMMFRSGWGTKENQESTLAIRIKREAFDEILSLAVYSSYSEEIYGSYESWQDAVKNSNVRLQWDPDHDPSGEKLERRAVQLGLRKDILRKFSEEWVIEIEDISDFVKEQRGNLPRRAELLTPRERVYPISNQETAAKMRISPLED